METVLIDYIYSPDIFDLKFGSQTFIPLLEAVLSSKGSVAEGCRAGELGSHQKVGKLYHPLAFGHNQAGHCHLMASLWLSTMLRSRSNTMKGYYNQEGQWKALSNANCTGTSIVCAFEAAITAIIRKVSNLRVWGLGRLSGFCNPAHYDI